MPDRLAPRSATQAAATPSPQGLHFSQGQGTCRRALHGGLHMAGWRQLGPTALDQRAAYRQCLGLLLVCCIP